MKKFKQDKIPILEGAEFVRVGGKGLLKVPRRLYDKKEVDRLRKTMGRIIDEV